MTGHDLDLREWFTSGCWVGAPMPMGEAEPIMLARSEDAAAEIVRDHNGLVAEVESLRAKLDSAGRALAVMQNHEIRADQAEAKLVAAEQERDSIFGEALRYKRLRIEEKSRADRAEAALAAVRELAGTWKRRNWKITEGAACDHLFHALAAAEQPAPADRSGEQ